VIKVGIDILGCKGWGRRVCAYVGGRGGSYVGAYVGGRAGEGAMVSCILLLHFVFEKLSGWTVFKVYLCYLSI